MFFKNLQVYRLGALSIDAAQLAGALQAHAFSPCASNEVQRVGFVPPRPSVHDHEVYSVAGQWLVALCTETKVLPAAAVNQATNARADEIEEQQGFRPGRKAMKQLRENVLDEMTPRAFSTRSTTYAWIDPVNGWLVVDAASPSKADNVIKFLLRAVDKFPLESLRVQRSPVGAMTAWLDADEAPYEFSIDQDTELRATGDGGAAVRFVKHTLDPEDVRRHIAAGKQCTRLAMTWRARISFTLTESLALRGVRPLDVLREGDATARNDDERFDGDMALMTGELAALLADVVEALGGEAKA